MGYVLIIIFICGILFYIFQKDQIADLKENGIKVTGTVIRNGESGAKSSRRLGGNINDPTIKFITKQGEEIIGKPLIGFISQTEVIVPGLIDVIYDPQKPERFCLDI